MTDWVKMTSWNGQSGSVTGSVAGIIVSSLGECGSNGVISILFAVATLV